MQLDSGSTVALVVAVAVPLAMKALARFFPDRAPPVATAASLEELQARYGKWDAIVFLVAAAACAPLGWLLWLALRGLAAAIAALLPPAEFLWVVGPPYWGLPAALLAFGLLFPVASWVERRLLGERLAEYRVYQRLKTRMDVARVGRLFGTVLALAAAVAILLGLDCSVQLRADELVINRYLGLGEVRHPMHEVVAIRTAPALVAPNGNLVARREYVVRFADGTSWSTNGLLAEVTPEERRRFAERLAELSGAPVEEVEVLTNEEL
jgi:hypothetical protein